MSEAPPPGHVGDLSLVHGEDVAFTGHGGASVGAYVARPAAGGGYPAIVLIHAAPGATEHYRDVARRIAALGYVVALPDLYSRTSPPSMENFEAMMAVLFAMDDGVVIGDLQAALGYLRSRSDVSGPFGTIGFCMGGRYALLLACTSDQLSAAVDCWGGFITRADHDNRCTPARPVPPIELVPQLHCALLAAIGLDDQNPSPADGELLANALALTGQSTRVDFYENASHAFFDDTRANYRPVAAAMLWARIGEFFAVHLHS